MTPTKKYYFTRVEKATVYANNEDDAREQLKQFYAETEDFILDDVIEGVDIDGVFHPMSIQQTTNSPTHDNAQAHGRLG